MKLLSSPASPFGAKVKIWAHMLGLQAQLQVEAINTIELAQSGDHPNPLGKIPALITRADGCIFDSAVICVLAAQTGSVYLSEGWERRLYLAAVNGPTEAALSWVYEQRMHTPEQISENYLAPQLGKIERTLLWLESNTPVEPGMDIADAALAAALSYLDLRWDQPWRNGHLTWRIGWLHSHSGIPGLVKLSPTRQIRRKVRLMRGLAHFDKARLGN